MFDGFKREKVRKARMQELTAYIDKVTADEYRDAKTPQERGEAGDIIFQTTRYEQNELEYLQQRPLLDKLRESPIEVPEEYWTDDPNDVTTLPTLTVNGQIWARHELKKLRNTEVEFWFKLVMPVVALILSIIALVSKRH